VKIHDPKAKAAEKIAAAKSVEKQFGLKLVS
jgi:hypothetical protein